MIELLDLGGSLVFMVIWNVPVDVTLGITFDPSQTALFIHGWLWEISMVSSPKVKKEASTNIQIGILLVFVKLCLIVGC